MWLLPPQPDSPETEDGPPAGTHTVHPADGAAAWSPGEYIFPDVTGTLLDTSD